MEEKKKEHRMYPEENSLTRMSGIGNYIHFNPVHIYLNELDDFLNLIEQKFEYSELTLKPPTYPIFVNKKEITALSVLQRMTIIHHYWKKKPDQELIKKLKNNGHVVLSGGFVINGKRNR